MTIQLEDLKSTFTLDSKGLQLGAKAAIAGVGAVVAGMGVAIKATMDWASDLDSLGDVMDGSKKDFAALAFVARKSGVGVETLTKANVILEKSLLKSNGTLDVTGGKLQMYGIRVRDANGNVRDSVQLTDEIAKKYAQLSTQTERINFLTEIYGKNGAALVDFFDTLNSEGGISAVTKKVEAFGLAIDPDRYEQFNRNLEELKLIGLGLAVSFTERVMPVLEGFLGWVSKASQSPSFAKLKKAVDTLFKDLFGGGGASSQFDLKNSERAKSFDNQIADLIDEIDWEGAGQKFGEALDKALAQGIEKQSLPMSIQSFGKGINDFFLAASGADKFGGWKQFFTEWDRQSRQNGVQFWKNLGNMVITNVKTLFTQAIPAGLDSLVSFNVAIQQKLRDIAKQFFNRAVAWGQQMVLGFSSNSKKVLDVISDLVGQINAILKKIITSFTLRFQMSDNTGSMGGAAGTGGGSTGGSGGGRKRATGGSVISGQPYSVVELNKPEVFTPSTSGRIDPKKETKVVVDFDYNKLARAMMQLGLRTA